MIQLSVIRSSWCVCVCVCACVRACVRACVCGCVRDVYLTGFVVLAVSNLIYLLYSFGGKRGGKGKRVGNFGCPFPP